VLRAAALVAILLSGLLGCASNAAMAAGPRSTAVPANYRQLVAAKLRQMIDVSVVRSPQISGPRQRFVGLFQGGTRPTVCVRLTKPNSFGLSAVHLYLFYFDNGRAEGFQQVAYSFAQQALNGCDPPLTPFTELTRSR
jgi:hypothetical protein